MSSLSRNSPTDHLDVALKGIDRYNPVYHRLSSIHFDVHQLTSNSRSTEPSPSLFRLVRYHPNVAKNDAALLGTKLTSLDNNYLFDADSAVRSACEGLSLDDIKLRNDWGLGLDTAVTQMDSRPRINESDLRETFARRFGTLLEGLLRHLSPAELELYLSPEGNMGRNVDGGVADPLLGWLLGLEWKTEKTFPHAGVAEVVALLKRSSCWLFVSPEDHNRFFLVPEDDKLRTALIDGNVGRCILQGIGYMVTPAELSLGASPDPSKTTEESVTIARDAAQTEAAAMPSRNLPAADEGTWAMEAGEHVGPMTRSMRIKAKVKEVTGMLSPTKKAKQRAPLPEELRQGKARKIVPGQENERGGRKTDTAAITEAERRSQCRAVMLTNGSDALLMVRRPKVMPFFEFALSPLIPLSSCENSCHFVWRLALT